MSTEITDELNSGIREHLRELQRKQSEIDDKSLIMVHTGDGKGKTTAAMGVLFRTVAHGWPAAVVQFMKNPDEFHYGERKVAEKFPNLDWFTMGAGFTWDTNDRSKDITTSLATWEKARELIYSGKYHLILLDEINYVLDYGFLPVSDVADVLRNKPPHLNLILTGRNAPQEIIDLADLVTEMRNVKHPFDTRGLLAQKGIEW